MSEIAGSNIVITGGASGIGRLIAKKLAALGGYVVIWDVNQGNLDKVVSEINAMTRQPALGFVCDVSRREEVYRVAEQVKVAAGPVDILINNAGIVSGKQLLDIPDEKIVMTFAINTLALFWTAKAFLPQMIKRNRGHIVNVASASALVGVAQLSDYAASKWATMGFDESLRAELKQVSPGVRTTVVCPYYINTGMFKGVKSRVPWLLPILEADYVAERVVTAIRRNQPRVMMPTILYLLPPMRFLPVVVFDWIADFLGINVAMSAFTGRQGEPDKAVQRTQGA